MAEQTTTQNTQSITMTEAIEMYECMMEAPDLIAYQIAKKQLESSFDIEKSIGFLEFIEKNNIKIEK